MSPPAGFNKKNGGSKESVGIARIGQVASLFTEMENCTDSAHF